MNNINIIFEKLETSSAMCTCQDAMYLHRLYLNIEHNIEIFFKESGRKLNQTASYHKDLLVDYCKLLGLEKSDTFCIIDELRAFRHVFNKRADIFEFVAENIEKLKTKILGLKEKILEQFGGI